MPTTCTDTIVTDNLEFCVDTEVAVGISTVEIFACPVKDFDTIAKPPAKNVATTLEEAGTISDAHTFTGDLGFFKINILPNTGLIETTSEGDPGTKTCANSFSGVLQGTTAKIAGFIRKYQNLPMIFLVTEVTGEVKQIGSQYSPAFLTELTGTSGQKAGDVKGTTVKFADTQAYPAPTYTGAITEFTPPTP